MLYPLSALERAMKVKEVIARALNGDGPFQRRVACSVPAEDRARLRELLGRLIQMFQRQA